MLGAKEADLTLRKLVLSGDIGPMYDLESLGWNSFQQLCLTIAREVLGQTVEAFLDSNDGGRDGAFAGQWKPAGGEHLTGRFVIQCKFTSRPNSSLRPSDLSDELPKVKRLVEQGLCDSYVLMTNAGLSGRHSELIEGLLRGSGVTHTALYGSTWITQQIRENKRLRMLVPRVYGLGDLSQILDERAYDQARAILESLREDLAKVVVTESYRKAAVALDNHGFVLLIGEPAAGKTTIASMLAMAGVDQWNASVLKLDDPGKLMDRWNPREPSQFFWLDDAFGVTQYESHLVSAWNHTLSHIRSVLRKGAKIVMTSRDYIYNHARKELKEGAFPLLRESQVVIDVHDLTLDERRQILYNHMKLGRQPRSFRSEIKPHLEHVAGHQAFIPEIARRLADPLFTEGLHLDEYHLGEFVAKRERFLQDVLQSLDANSKAALALIYMRNDRLESPISLDGAEQRALERLGSDLGRCVTALEALNGSLVLYAHSGPDSVWRFKHPTIGDAYGANLAASPELLGIFLRGTAPDELIQQVTCGNVGLENAIIIPKALFPDVLLKLRGFSNSMNSKSIRLAVWGAKSALQGFLARRCSKEFLVLYLEEHPELLDTVAQPGLYLSAAPEVDVAARLHEFGLLPEDKRKVFVATVSEYAVQGEDLYALDDADIRSVFEDDEFEDLLRKVRTQLIPRLGNVRCAMQRDHTSGESAEEHMQPLLESFETLKRHFADDEQIAKVVDDETRRVNEWIAEHEPEEPCTKPRPLGKVEAIEPGSQARSIFDDIDA
jgi:energy-coupling factor transporter ATP-binding protein EcfA2